MLEPEQGQAIYGPGGCDECLQVGYAGRSGLFEILAVNQEIRRLIASSSTAQEIEKAATKAGMLIFRKAALLKVAQGVTSTEEILRDVPAEHLGLEE